jgi:SAM-dependent methyltransferase
VGDRTAAPDIPGAQVDSDHENRVRSLFERKAARWPGKYEPGGPLAGRLAQLAAVIAEMVPPGGELLDLGCASGELARSLAVAGYQVTGCDIAPRMLRQAAAADDVRAVRWVELEPGWQMLPFAAGRLDAIVAASVLEYVRNPGAVLSESARILRPGGVLLCTVPNVAHPIRWLEWPLGLVAKSPLTSLAGRAHGRPAQYLAYLRTSRQRWRVRWWHTAARRVGLMPVPVPRTRREPLHLLAFTRPGNTGGQQLDTMGDRSDDAGNH